MASVEIVLLGGFQVRSAVQAIDVPGRKERALLAVLAMPPGEPRSRDKLAGLLWSDRGDKQARDSLKQAVLKLRKSLDCVHPSPLLADRESVTLDGGAVAVDVAEFERLIGAGTPESVARAVALYRGDLLDGFDVRDSAFDEWLLLERQRLRDLAREALAKLLERQMASGAHDPAGATARRLLMLDPLREVAHRALMQIYAAQGQTALALKQYQLCRDALQRELGVKPESETERLYRTVQEKRTAARQTPDQAPAAQVAAETGPLPDPPPLKHEPETAAAFAKPSIAVLPFTNLSADPEQQYFSDGISEDIITELSRFRQLHVFARNASFRYRGQEVDPLRVARELGVEFLVEGSVRRLGDRIRITAQLIDAGTGHHVWAERFDRHQEELFGVQDQVVRTIVGTLVGRLQAAGAERIRRKPPASLAAYECVLRGDALPFESPEGATEARRLFEKAIELDPGYARAYALLAAMVHREWLRDMSGSDSLLDQAFELAKKAVALDQNDDLCHCELAWIYLARHSFELAEHHQLKALELNRNGSVVMASLGQMYVFLGKTAQGMNFFEEAKLLNPLFDPTWYYPFLGAANFIARRHNEAIAALSRSSTMPFWAQAYLAASYAMTDRIDYARRCAAEVVRLVPDFSLTRFAAKVPLKHAADRQHLIDGLRKAGLPE